MKKFVSFCLDETGSMGGIAEQTVSAFNEYLAGLKTSGEDILFSLMRFNSAKTLLSHKSQPIVEVGELADYQPADTTPLYDAACKLIDATEEKADSDDRVVIVIQTDGHENASRQFTRQDLEDRIKRLTAVGWEFIFLGADIDAYDTASSLGISAGHTVSYNPKLSMDVYASSLVDNTSAYLRGTVASTAFSAAQKQSAGDTYSTNEVDPNDQKASAAARPSLVDDTEV